LESGIWFGHLTHWTGFMFPVPIDSRLENEFLLWSTDKLHH
jgi:hypothetical protein